jgi:hypothetical protein
VSQPKAMAYAVSHNLFPDESMHTEK